MTYDSLTEDQRFQLLQLIQERPILYDKSNEGYKNVTEKELAWQDVARRVRAQVNACKVAWKSMRDQYQRNMKLPKEKRKNFRYLPKMSFLNGKTKAFRNSSSLSMDDFTSEYYYDNTSNTPKHELEYDDSTDYGDYNETTTTIEPAENISKLDEPNTKSAANNIEKIDDKLSVPLSPHEEEEYIYIKEGKEDPDYNIENMASTLFDTFNNLINKRYQSNEDDNDLFMKMLAKKMKTLPNLVRNRLQESFLEQVNYEITNNEIQRNKRRKLS